MTGSDVLFLLVLFLSIFHAIAIGDRILSKRAERKRTAAMITAVMNGAAGID